MYSLRAYFRSFLLTTTLSNTFRWQTPKIKSGMCEKLRLRFLNLAAVLYYHLSRISA